MNTHLLKNIIPILFLLFIDDQSSTLDLTPVTIIYSSIAPIDCKLAKYWQKCVSSIIDVILNK